MVNEKELPAHLLLYLSPVHRLYGTMTPPDLMRVFDVKSKEPLFAFGEGAAQWPPLRTIESVEDFLSKKPIGVNFLSIKEIEASKLLLSALTKGHIKVNHTEGATITHLDKEIPFSLQSNLTIEKPELQSESPTPHQENKQTITIR